MQLIETLEVRNKLGEGVIWDHQEGKIWWTDIELSQLYRYDPETKKLDQWQTPERLCCFAPRTNSTDLIAAFASGFAFYQPETGQLEWQHKVESENLGTRLNDGRTDRQGRMWAGTMVENADQAQYKGSLYCLDKDLKLRKTLKGLTITNSLCWSPDGRTMYHTDTPSRKINQYTFVPETGEFGDAELFAKTNKGCYPDGSIVDADGYLWNAQWGGAQVVRYAPDGTEDLVLEIPTSQPSCVAFGGKDLNLLCVTSAWQDMGPPARVKDPQAGNFFIFETEFQGLAEHAFAG